MIGIGTTKRRIDWRTDRRGGALLAVLWLSAALSVIAFSVASTVRGETERASTLADGLRSYYLARGGLDRAIMYFVLGSKALGPPGTPASYDRETPLMRFEFPAGIAIVELIPETARLNINEASVDDLLRLLAALGVAPPQAQEIAAAIEDWRSPRTPGAFDQYYLSRQPSFPARHTSMEEVEEVLLVKGMTPEIFYGRHVRDQEGRLVRLAGLRDCVSVFGETKSFDVNAAEPALLASLGMAPEGVRQLVEFRRRMPIEKMEQLDPIAPLFGTAAGRLRVGGNTIYTLRSTARLRLADGKFGDLRRTVAAQVKVLARGVPRYHVLRWYDHATSEEVAQWQ